MARTETTFIVAVLPRMFQMKTGIGTILMSYPAVGFGIHMRRIRVSRRIMKVTLLFNLWRAGVCLGRMRLRSGVTFHRMVL